jgi:hypothetical protein
MEKADILKETACWERPIKWLKDLLVFVTDYANLTLGRKMVIDLLSVKADICCHPWLLDLLFTGCNSQIITCPCFEALWCIEMLLYMSVIELYVVFCVYKEVFFFLFWVCDVTRQNMAGTLWNILISIFNFYLM